MSRHSIGFPGLNDTVDATGLACLPGATGDVGPSVSLDPLVDGPPGADGAPGMLQMVHQEPFRATGSVGPSGTPCMHCTLSVYHCANES